MRKRAVPLAFLVLDVGLVLGAVAFGQGETVQPFRNLLTAVGVVGWWAVPAIGLLLFRTMTGVVAVGSALLIGIAVALLSIYASTSSTAAIGFLTVPVLQACFVAVCCLLEALLSRT